MTRLIDRESTRMTYTVMDGVNRELYLKNVKKRESPRETNGDGDEHEKKVKRRYGE